LSVLPVGTIIPQGNHSIQFVVKGANGKPLQGFQYEVIQKSTGIPVLRGSTDFDGCTERYFTDLEQDSFDLHEYAEFGGGVINAPSAKELDGRDHLA